jgi:putative sterol carrier protein
MTPSELFEQMKSRIAERPGLVEEVGASFRFDVDGDDGGSWLVDLSEAPGQVRDGDGEDADCIITVNQADFVGIMSGDVDPQMAFMMGRIKVAGNFMLATKLRSLL